MSIRSNVRSLFIPSLRMAVASEPAAASRGALDGRNFDGIVLKCGETSGDADTLSFKDGRFRSSACDPVRLWRRRLHGDAVGRDGRVRSRDREPAVRQAALERRGARAAPRRHDDDGSRRPGRGEKWILAGEKS